MERIPPPIKGVSSSVDPPTRDFGPGDLEVCDLEAFLRRTSEDWSDQVEMELRAVIKSRLDRVAREIVYWDSGRNYGRPYELGPDEEWVSVLDDQEASDLLHDMLDCEAGIEKEEAMATMNPFRAANTNVALVRLAEMNEYM